MLLKLFINAANMCLGMHSFLNKYKAKFNQKYNTCVYIYIYFHEYLKMAHAE